MTEVLSSDKPVERTAEDAPFVWEFERYPALRDWMLRFASVGMAMNMFDWQKFCKDLDAALRQAKAAAGKKE